MAATDVGPVLAKEFVVLKIDYDRAKGAKEIETRYIDKEQGLPWFFILDGSAHLIAHSTRASGNVGMPWEPDEVVHFQTMLEKAKKHLSSDEIAMLIRSIQDFRKKTEAGQ